MRSSSVRPSGGAVVEGLKRTGATDRRPASCPPLCHCILRPVRDCWPCPGRPRRRLHACAWRWAPDPAGRPHDRRPSCMPDSRRPRAPRQQALMKQHKIGQVNAPMTGLGSAANVSVAGPPMLKLLYWAVRCPLPCVLATRRSCPIIRRLAALVCVPCSQRIQTRLLSCPQGHKALPQAVPAHQALPCSSIGCGGAGCRASTCSG